MATVEDVTMEPEADNAVSVAVDPEDGLPPIELPPPVNLQSVSLDRLGVLLLQLHKVCVFAGHVGLFRRVLDCVRVRGGCAHE